MACETAVGYVWSHCIPLFDSTNLCPLPRAASSNRELLAAPRALLGGPCGSESPSEVPGLRHWENTATNCWASHLSREVTKHFNGHLTNAVASIFWFVRASLPLEIHPLLKLIVFPYFTVHPDDLSPMFVILHEMAICFLFPHVSHFSGSRMYLVVSLS